MTEEPDFSNIASAMTGEAPEKRKRKSAKGELANAQDLVPVLESIADLSDNLKESLKGMTIQVNMPEQPSNQQTQPPQQLPPQQPQSSQMQKSTLEADLETLELDELIVKYGTYYPKFDTYGMMASDYKNITGYNRENSRKRLLKACDPDRSTPIVKESMFKYPKVKKAYQKNPINRLFGEVIHPKGRKATFLFLVPKDRITEIKRRLKLENEGG